MSEDIAAGLAIVIGAIAIGTGSLAALHGHLDIALLIARAVLTLIALTFVLFGVLGLCALVYDSVTGDEL